MSQKTNIVDKKADIGQLLESVGQLKSIQEGFDSYQNAYFETRSPEFFCLELNGEAGELANLEKKQWKGREIDHDRFGDEAADVLIALMNYCNARNVSLGQCVATKLQKIETKRQEMASSGQSY
ncbi:MAG: hypothetical protein Kapaf2KO_02630 [Candidatus Kapaibacteriales bacterium]